jgi:hypothetical protein
MRYLPKKRYALTLALAILGLVVGMALWEASFGAGILLVMSFAAAPSCFFPFARSTFENALWSHVFCLSEILGNSLRYYHFQIEQNAALDWTSLRDQVVLMLVLVNGVLFVHSLFPAVAKPPTEANER